MSDLRTPAHPLGELDRDRVVVERFRAAGPQHAACGHLIERGDGLYCYGDSPLGPALWSCCRDWRHASVDSASSTAWPSDDHDLPRLLSDLRRRRELSRLSLRFAPRGEGRRAMFVVRARRV